MYDYKELDQTYDSLFNSKYENVIHADGRYASCQDGIMHNKLRKEKERIMRSGW